MKFNQEQISKLKEIKKDLIEIKEKKSAIKNFEDFIKKGKLPELLVSIQTLARSINSSHHSSFCWFVILF